MSADRQPAAAPSAGDVFTPEDLLVLRDLSAAAFTVWTIVAEHARPGRPARLTRETIARRIGGANPATITRAVEQLEAAGWLKVTRIRAKGKSVNLYEPLGTIAAGDASRSRRWVVLAEHHRAALEIGAITPQQLRSLARWLFLGRREGWTRSTLPEYVERFGGSTDTAKRDRAALVRGGYLETRPEPFGRTVTAAPGRLPSARSTASQPPSPPGGMDATPRGAREQLLGGHESDREVTLGRSNPRLEVTACGPARRARQGRNARAAATTAPPAPRAEKIEEQKPERVDQLDEPHRRDERTEQETRNAAGVLLPQFPDGYQRQEERYRRATIGRLARALADGYGPEAILRVVERHDRPEHNPTQTLELALRELAADVHDGACPECGRSAEDAPVVCDRCNPDRDTITADELARLVADGWNIEATA